MKIAPDPLPFNPALTTGLSRVARSLEIFSRTFFSIRFGQWRDDV